MSDYRLYRLMNQDHVNWEDRNDVHREDAHWGYWLLVILIGFPLLTILGLVEKIDKKIIQPLGRLIGYIEGDS